jgi:xylulokinase
MYLGIDLGTSAVKAILLRDDGTVAAQSSAPLEVSRPHPSWSEQDPEHWWRAANSAVQQLRSVHKAGLAAVKAVGLSGQMHGATLLDESDKVLRPAILWNDGRSGKECAELEEACPKLRQITGNMAMPGFTAPKLVWVRKHEPAIFNKIGKVLLPKDYLRLRMTGDHASDLSDSAGTLWLDVGGRHWSDLVLDACGLGRVHMPKLFEGSEPTGTLRAEIATAWGMSRVPVAAGAGDQAAGAIGAGVIAPGQAFLSLGTSGVYFVADDHYRPNPAGGVHTFCHALPKTWHQMAVILSAAACVSWVTQLTRAENEAALMAELEEAGKNPGRFDQAPLFLPYLSGERTPHNDPNARGVFFGLSHESQRPELAYAVLEGVAFALADGQAALLDAGTKIGEVSVIGGGSRGAFWGRILADVLQRPLVYREAADVGPALGAARLARLAVTGERASAVCAQPPIQRRVEPRADAATTVARRYDLYKHLYRDLKMSFDSFSAA